METISLRPFLTRSLDRDLLFGLIPTIIILGVVLGSVYYSVTTKKEYNNLYENAVELTENLARISMNPVFLSEPNKLPSILGEYMKGTYVNSVEIYDKKNNRSYINTNDFHGPTITIEKPIIMLEEKIGTVKVVFITNHILERQKQVFYYTLILIICYIVVVSIVVIVLLRRFLRRPILELVNSIKMIADGSYDLPMKHQYLDIIAKEVNSMADKICERERQLLSYQKKLRAMTKKLFETEERERRDISTDLHDRIGHALTNVAIKIALLKDYVTHAESRQILMEIRELVEQSATDVRSMIFEISPPILHDIGLIAAIGWLSEHMTKEHKLNVDFEPQPELKGLSNSIKVIAFRAVRELLFNVIKHSKADYVEILISSQKGLLCISVQDNGIGMQKVVSEENIEHTGFGLFNIFERLSYLNGKLIIISTQERGTRIVMEIPEI